MFRPTPEFPLLVATLEAVAQMVKADFPNASPLLQAQAEVWMSTYKPSTVFGRRKDLERWINWARTRGPGFCALSQSGVEQYLDSFRERNRAKSSMRRALQSIHAVVAAVTPEDHELRAFTRQSGTRLVPPHNVAFAQEHITESINRERLLQLARAVDPHCVRDARTIAMLFVLYDTGLPSYRVFGQRFHEDWIIAPLRSANLVADGDEGILTVAATATENPMRCRISAEGMHWIRHYHRLRGPDDAMFTNRRGLCATARSWGDHLRSLQRRAGFGDIRFGVDSCRRGAARDLLVAGRTPLEICQSLQWRTTLPVLRMLGNGSAQLRIAAPAPAPSFLPAPPESVPVYTDRYLRPGAHGHAPSAPESPVPDLFAGT